MNIICRDSWGNQIKSLTQWDLNRSIVIEGLDEFNLEAAPMVHFFNSKSSSALVVESELGTTSANNVQITVDIPNILLQDPLELFAFVYAEHPDNAGELISVCRVSFPVVPRKKPMEYEHLENIGYSNWRELTTEAAEVIAATTEANEYAGTLIEALESTNPNSLAPATIFSNFNITLTTRTVSDKIYYNVTTDSGITVAVNAGASLGRIFTNVPALDVDFDETASSPYPCVVYIDHNREVKVTSKTIVENGVTIIAYLLTNRGIIVNTPNPGSCTYTYVDTDRDTTYSKTVEEWQNPQTFREIYGAAGISPMCILTDVMFTLTVDYTDSENRTGTTYTLNVDQNFSAVINPKTSGATRFYKSISKDLFPIQCTDTQTDVYPCCLSIDESGSPRLSTLKNASATSTVIAYFFSNRGFITNALNSERVKYKFISKPAQNTQERTVVEKDLLHWTAGTAMSLLETVDARSSQTKSELEFASSVLAMLRNLVNSQFGVQLVELSFPDSRSNKFVAVTGRLGASSGWDYSSDVSLQAGDTVIVEMSSTGNNISVLALTDSHTVSDEVIPYTSVQGASSGTVRKSYIISVETTGDYVVNRMKGEPLPVVYKIGSDSILRDTEGTIHDTIAGTVNSGFRGVGARLDGLDGAMTQVEETIKCLKMVYVDGVTGSDENEGSQSAPYKTIGKALQSGSDTIIITPGVYTEHIDVANRGKLTITTAKQGTEGKVRLFDATEFTVTQKENSENLWENTDLDFSTGDSLIKRTYVNVPKPYEADTTENAYVFPSGGARKKNAYRCALFETDENVTEIKRLKPMATAEACAAQEGSFYYASDTGMLVHPFGDTITQKKFWYPNNDVRGGVATNGATFSNIGRLDLDGFEILGGAAYNFLFEDVGGGTVTGCASNCTMRSTGFHTDRCSLDFVNCFSTGAAADGFGFLGDGIVNLTDCDGSDNCDDGVSHHYPSCGTVTGGSFLRNGKAGIAPAYGSKVDVYGVICTDNNYGIRYASDSDNSHVHGETCYVSNCVLHNNVSSGVKADIEAVYYNVIAWNTSLDAYSIGDGGTVKMENDSVITDPLKLRWIHGCYTNADGIISRTEKRICAPLIKVKAGSEVKAPSGYTVTVATYSENKANKNSFQELLNGSSSYVMSHDCWIGISVRHTVETDIEIEDIEEVAAVVELRLIVDGASTSDLQAEITDIKKTLSPRKTIGNGISCKVNARYSRRTESGVTYWSIKNGVQNYIQLMDDANGTYYIPVKKGDEIGAKSGYQYGVIVFPKNIDISLDKQTADLNIYYTGLQNGGGCLYEIPEDGYAVIAFAALDGNGSPKAIDESVTDGSGYTKSETIVTIAEIKDNTILRITNENTTDDYTRGLTENETSSPYYKEYNWGACKFPSYYRCLSTGLYDLFGIEATQETPYSEQYHEMLSEVVGIDTSGVTASDSESNITLVAADIEWFPGKYLKFGSVMSAMYHAETYYSVASELFFAKAGSTISVSGHPFDIALYKTRFSKNGESITNKDAGETYTLPKDAYVGVTIWKNTRSTSAAADVTNDSDCDTSNGLPATATFNVQTTERLTSEDGYVTRRLLYDDAGNSIISYTDGSTVSCKCYAYEFAPLSMESWGMYPDRVGNAPSMPTVVITSGQHGIETSSCFGLYYFLRDLVNCWEEDPFLSYLRHNVRLIVLPLMNPYGFNLRMKQASQGDPRKRADTNYGEPTQTWRANKRHVDLNRNYDFGFIDEVKSWLKKNYNLYSVAVTGGISPENAITHKTIQFEYMPCYGLNTLFTNSDFQSAMSESDVDSALDTFISEWNDDEGTLFKITPFSEQETQMIRSVIKEYENGISFFVDFHTQGGGDSVSSNRMVLWHMLTERAREDAYLRKLTNAAYVHINQISGYFAKDYPIVKGVGITNAQDREDVERDYRKNHGCVGSASFTSNQNAPDTSNWVGSLNIPAVTFEGFNRFYKEPVAFSEDEQKANAELIGNWLRIALNALSD